MGAQGRGCKGSLRCGGGPSCERRRSPVLAQHRKGFEKITRQYVATHLRAVRRVSEFIAYQRLFALWHVVHRPFFALLLVALAIHLYAVYRY